MGESLVSSITQFDSGNVDKFQMIMGVGDSSTFDTVPSWKQPSDKQDLCYIGAHRFAALLRIL